MKCLIVDDEPMIRKGIQQLIDFQSLGIDEVFEASNGVEAFRIVKELHPSIVLADINMPLMDGLTLAKAIKAFDRNIQIAIITGYDYFDYAITALKAGVDDFVLKPLSKNDVQLLLKKLADSAREAQGWEIALRTLSKLQHLEPQDTTYGLDYINEIKRVMDEDMSDPDFSLVALAGKINLSAGYLSGLFKQIFGIPFQDYLIKARLDRAKILLLTTSSKVYEIAAQAGFEDPNYFSSSFKKRFGQTPNQFRDSPVDNR